MTGLWQVSGRSDVDYETRVYLDAWYVKNWSMWNDIAILFKTVGVVLKRWGILIIPIDKKYNHTTGELRFI